MPRYFEMAPSTTWLGFGLLMIQPEKAMHLPEVSEEQAASDKFVFVNSGGDKKQ